MIQFQCPNCGRQFKLRQERSGRKGRCPQCRQVIQVPDTPQDGQLQPPLPTIDQLATHTPDTDKAVTVSGKRRSRLPNWAMAAGIVAIPVPGVEIAAVVLGTIALNAADEHDDNLAGNNADRRKAITGIVLGAAAFLLHILAVIVLLLFVFLLPQSRQQATPAPAPPRHLRHRQRLSKPRLQFRRQPAKPSRHHRNARGRPGTTI